MISDLSVCHWDLWSKLREEDLWPSDLLMRTIRDIGKGTEVEMVRILK